MPVCRRSRRSGCKRGCLPIVHAEWRHILSVPFIYLVAVPLGLLDLSINLYQLVCFPLYRIPRVRRRDFFVYDRGRLAYLNVLEKLNCQYCAYATGLLAYAREVVGRTEHTGARSARQARGRRAARARPCLPVCRLWRCGCLSPATGTAAPGAGSPARSIMRDAGDRGQAPRQACGRFSCQPEAGS